VVNATGSPLTSPGPVQPRFLRVLRNLRRLMHARSGLQYLQPEVALTAMLDHRDLPQLPNLIRFAHDEGIEDMTVEVADHDADAAARPAAPPPQDSRQRRMLGEAQRLARTLGVTLQPLHFLRDGHGPGGVPRIGRISHNGETYPEPRCSG
jgi:hypothetical protein